jgi:hypothetical protein
MYLEALAPGIAPQLTETVGRVALAGIWNNYGSMLFAYAAVMPAGAD